MSLDLFMALLLSFLVGCTVGSLVTLAWDGAA